MPIRGGNGSILIVLLVVVRILRTHCPDPSDSLSGVSGQRVHGSISTVLPSYLVCIESFFLRYLVPRAFTDHRCVAFNAIGIVNDKLHVGNLQPEIALTVAIHTLDKAHLYWGLVRRLTQFDASIQLIKSLWLPGQIHSTPYIEGFGVVVGMCEDT